MGAESSYEFLAFYGMQYLGLIPSVLSLLLNVIILCYSSKIMALVFFLNVFAVCFEYLALGTPSEFGLHAVLVTFGRQKSVFFCIG